MDKKDVSVETEGKIWVRRQYRKMGQDADEGQLEEHRILVDKFETEPAVAECALGLTINLGNYESLRIDVGVKIPCYKEELVQAHQEAFRICEAELMRRKREVEETL